jgi:hypothetical protein
MSRVFQNIDPLPPSPPGKCVPHSFVAGGGHTSMLQSYFNNTGGTSKGVMTSILPSKRPTDFYSRTKAYRQSLVLKLAENNIKPKAVLISHEKDIFCFLDHWSN